MFENCKNIEYIEDDVSKFDLMSLEKADRIFAGCGTNTSFNNRETFMSADDDILYGNGIYKKSECERLEDKFDKRLGVGQYSKLYQDVWGDPNDSIFAN